MASVTVTLDPNEMEAAIRNFAKDKIHGAEGFSGVKPSCINFVRDGEGSILRVEVLFE